ncbi:MAG TPA: tRNA pseudouridine(55) synthase TruB [Solirubrobacteraceae bacterium]|nr:tRNA pseudouridine(55) synthase TruB [Solirubrobacteraceae bacterium]
MDGGDRVPPTGISPTRVPPTGISPSGDAGAAAGPPSQGDYVLVCDKPAGVTSHDVVARIRRRLPRRTKVGHAGTLDPFATGLLLVLVGRATRAQRFLMALPKRYEVVARFGACSSTGDPEGEITETGVVPTGDLPLPTGRIRQRPPAHSAVKVAGRRAYALARAGETVELPERDVTVTRFEERWRDGDHRGFVIECSSGTYVRSLIADLGDAYCLELRRTAVGPFDVEQADDSSPIPLPDAISFLPAVRLGAEQGRRVAQGQRLALSAAPAAAVRILDPEGLVALGELRATEEPGTALLTPTVGLRG